MKDRPILFDAESMRRFLAGEKTETRRPIDPQPLGYDPVFNGEGVWEFCDDRDPEPRHVHRCPYGVPGDSLWGRESWTLDRILGWPSWRKVGRYLADGSQWSVRMDRDLRVIHTIGKKPSIFMPREVSRLDCELLGVKAQRIQSMTPEEITAEGVTLAYFETNGVSSKRARLLQLVAWIDRWDGINADRGYPYADNPWVWALTLRPRFH